MNEVFFAELSAWLTEAGLAGTLLNTDTVGKSAAQSISARKAVEPFLERRIGETSVVTRVLAVWNDHSDAQHNPPTVSLYIVVTTTSPAVACT